MKRQLLLVVLIFFALQSNAAENPADLFKYDRQALAMEMAQLDILEGALLDNPDMVHSLLADLGIHLAYPGGNVCGTNVINEQVLGIPGFWWGCCLGLPGVVIVAVAGKDDAETNSAVKGLLVTLGTTLVSTVVLVVAGVIFEVWLIDYYY